jgi:O-methyltransferase
MIKHTLKKIIALIFGNFHQYLRAISGVTVFFQYLEKNSKGSKLIEGTKQFYDFINTIHGDRPTLYLEFGVFEGESILYFSKINKNSNSIFYGFDCFEGLPEDWNLTGGGVIKKGTFDVGGAMPITDDQRVHFIKGYFQNTLIGFLEEKNDLLKSMKKVIHFDADLYSSELFCLTQLFKYLNDGDVLFFDDFFVIEHDFRAFLDFSRSHLIQFEMVAHTKYFGKAAFKVTKTYEY